MDGPPAHNNAIEEAIQRLRQATAGQPAIAEFHNDLGGLLALTGRHREAEACFREAIRLRADYPEAHANLGVSAEEQGRAEEAERHLRHALLLRPDDPKFLSNLGSVLRKVGRLSESAEAYERALAARPDQPDALFALGTIRGDQGRTAEAVACLRRRAELLSDSPTAGSSLLLALHHLPEVTPQMLCAEHQAWAARHATRLYPESQPNFPNSRDPDRRLRIGYCSPDLRDHPVARFFEPLLAHHDRTRFHITCYSDLPPKLRDAVTERLSGYCDKWHEVHSQSDEQVADVVRRDQIDLLIDLAGHLNNPRLLLFARKPAPVQISFLGYPDTTGLPTIDYRFTDALHDPPGKTDELHAETLIRLSPCAWCYNPDDHGVQPNELPALKNGHITFGCLNRMSKVTPPMLRLWAQILDRVPESKVLVLTSKGAENDPGLLQAVAENGIPEHRQIRVGRRSRREYLKLYGQIDIALDTFPYNGHTTTLDAIWMGVPTVSLAGLHHVSRAGLSVLTTAGVPEMVTHSEGRYVEAAVALAQSPDRLTEYRQTLRQKMAVSPLRDAVRYAREIESKYTAVWRRWCSAAIAI